MPPITEQPGVWETISCVLRKRANYISENQPFIPWAGRFSILHELDLLDVRIISPEILELLNGEWEVSRIRHCHSVIVAEQTEGQGDTRLGWGIWVRGEKDIGARPQPFRPNRENG